MRITINGICQTIPDGSNITVMIDILGVKKPYAVSVNRQIIPRSNHQQHTLKTDDQIEIVQAVGGG